MGIREAVRLGWLYADRKKLPAHRPLRDAILRVQDAYQAELAERVAAEDAEFRNAGRDGSNGGVESTAELRARLTQFDENRRKKNRGNR